MTQKYPKKPSAKYSANYGLRLEPELKEALKELEALTDTDVPEAVRIKLRELVRELKPAA